MTIAKPKYPYSTLIYAKNRNVGNWGDLKRSTICGCYNCGTIFLSNQIYDWIGLDGKSADNATAICPFCGVNSIIAESSAYPLKKEFLDYVKEFCTEHEN